MGSNANSRLNVQPPFPWFGSKVAVAQTVWRALGDVVAYFEPFGGSLAVLLARPRNHSHTIEVVNDADCLLINFWRAVKWQPGMVAEHADWPKSEVDLIARSREVERRVGDLCDRVKANPRYFDPEVAGWWVWATCATIASSAFRSRGKAILPQIHSGDGINRMTITDLCEYFRNLGERMRRVAITCRDWRQIADLALKSTKRYGSVGVFLDPPYSIRQKGKSKVYRCDEQGISNEVREWAVKAGEIRNIRIVLAGYSAEHADHIPKHWRSYRWTARNCHRLPAEGRIREQLISETLWLSPSCHRLEELPFGARKLG